MRQKAMIAVAVVMATATFAIWMLANHRPEPMRGAWVTAWGRGLMTPAEVDRTIGAAKRARINTLFIECRKTADAYYRSRYEPMGRDVARGFDPLAYTIRKAHAQGIKVHAWVSVYRVWRGSTIPKNPNHLVNHHPEWLSYSRTGKLNAVDGIFINPGCPEATAYTTRVITDLVSKYDVDGLHLDFIRYPQADWGYSKVACKIYGAPDPAPNDPTWQMWKREQVSAHLRRIVRSVHAVKPGLPITAATIAYGDCPEDFTQTAAYKNLGQDWREWLSEGLLDANIPMNYKREANPDESRQFDDWLAGFTRWKGGKQMYVGVAGYLNAPDQIANQLKRIHAAGMDGFVVFCFNESGLRVQDDREELVRRLATTRYAH